MDKRGAFWILLRYIFLIIIAFPGLKLFYATFTPITAYLFAVLIKLFYSNAELISSTEIYLNGSIIKLIPACIAGAAYYFLLILNFATPMESKTRIKSLIFVILSFFSINLVRLLVFAVLFVGGFEYFNAAHKAVWYIGSTFILVVIWFVNIRLFKIKKIPVYSDFINIILEIKHEGAKK